MRVLPLLSLVSLSSAFLLPSLPSSTSPLSSTRGRALASSASEELSRKEKSKEQVRSLLKGLGELDDGENPTESTGSKRKVCILLLILYTLSCLASPSRLLTRPSHSIILSSFMNLSHLPPANDSISFTLPLPPSLPPLHPLLQEKREGLEAARRALSDKDSMKLKPETVFFEGAPHWSEVGREGGREGRLVRGWVGEDGE